MISGAKRGSLSGRARSWLPALWPLLRRQGSSERLIIFLLLSSVVFSAAWSLDRARWAPTLHSLSQLALVGLVAGFFAAHIRWPGIVLHLLAIALGLGVVFWQASLLLPEGDWWSRLAGVIPELRAWGHAVTSEETHDGIILFAMMLLSLTWLLGYLSAWLVFRGHRVWWAILPSGIIILVNIAYLRSYSYSHFFPYLMASLLLVAYSHMAQRQRRWVGAPSPGLVGVSFLGYVLCLGFLVAIVAWNLPQSKAAPMRNTLEPLSGPWQHVQVGFDRLFDSIKAKQPMRPAPVSTSFSPEWESYVVPDTTALDFGGALELSDTVIFITGSSGLYWRIRNYDIYTPQGWLSSEGIEVALDGEGSQIEGETFLERTLVTNTVTLAAYSSVFLSTGEPVSVDKPAVAEVRISTASAEAEKSAPATTEESTPGDVILLRNGEEGLIEPFEQFTVVSSLSVAGREDLHTAGPGYPRWVLSRYLELPENLPARVVDLSRRLTAGLENPHDKVQAIRSFLLKMEYNEDIEAPPRGADGVDYFLFDRRAGYCDYFASAMAVLGRASGIPSRLVVGYLADEWDEFNFVTMVRERDYHAWAEVYYPDYGWVEVEATPGLGLGAEAYEEWTGGGEFSAPPSPVETPGSGSSFLDALRDRLPVLAGLPGVVAAIMLFSRWRRRRRSCLQVSYVAQVYAKMCRWGSLSGLAPQPQHTPWEYAALLCSAVPSRAAAVRQIAQAYVQVRYSRHKALSLPEKEKLDKAWRSLRWTLGKRVFRRGVARGSPDRPKV